LRPQPSEQGDKGKSSAENQRGVADLTAVPIATVGFGRLTGSKAIRGAVKDVATTTKEAIPVIAKPVLKGAAVVGDIPKNIQAVLNPVKASEMLPPDALAIKATKPRNSIQNVKGQLATALPDARRAADSLGLKVTNLDEANQAVGQAKRDVWKEYQGNHLQPGKDSGLTIDGNKIADAMEGTINKRFETQNPHAAQAIRDLADQYRRPLPVAEAEDFLQGANNDLASYYAKNKVSQRTASLDPVKGHVVAEANTLRSELYKTLDGLTGSDAAALKKRYGSLNTLEDVINRRINVAERAAPESLIEQIGKIQAGIGMAKGAAKVILSPLVAGASIPGGIADIIGASRGLRAAKLSRQANDANFLIGKAFEKTSPTPQPRSLADILGSRGTEPPPELPPASGASPAPSGPRQGPFRPPQNTYPMPPSSVFGGEPPAPKASGMAAAPVEGRGIKAPQKRTFDRVDEKGVKDYFSYRFDQLRNEMKTAQASGEQSAIADVQRRMDELDQIQRQPRSLMDIIGGKQPTAVTSASAAAKDTGDFAQAKKTLPNASISEQLQEAQRIKDARNAKKTSIRHFHRATTTHGNREDGCWQLRKRYGSKNDDRQSASEVQSCRS
jgi:hypothetical protein